MGICTIDEYKRSPTGNSPGTTLVVTQHITTSGAAALSASFNEETLYIEVTADVNVYIEEGKSPVAVAAGSKSQMLLTPQIRPIYPTQQKNKISVIDKV